LEPRPWGRFIDVATELKVESGGVDRAARGAKFMAPGELSPIVRDFSCNVDDAKTAGNLLLSEVATAAFLTFNMLQCSTLSGDLDELEGYVSSAFEATKSEALATAATTALSASHVNLAVNSQPLASATSLVDVIATVEMGLAERISNQRGVIMIHPRQLGPAVSAGVIFLANEGLVSPAGHRVISDAGHRPYNVVYGTGVLGYSLMENHSPADLTSQLDRTRNIVTWMRETYALVVFNPAWSVRSTLTGGYAG
jgi:hypothetical protein